MQMINSGQQSYQPVKPGNQNKNSAQGDQPVGKDQSGTSGASQPGNEKESIQPGDNYNSQNGRMVCPGHLDIPCILKPPSVPDTITEEKEIHRFEVCHDPGTQIGYCAHLNEASAWSYIPESKTCVNFAYSGCGGSFNIFWKEKDCLKYCRDGLDIKDDEEPSAEHVFDEESNSREDSNFNEQEEDKKNDEHLLPMPDMKVFNSPKHNS